jgi:hypothetical protein
VRSLKQGYCLLDDPCLKAALSIDDGTLISEQSFFGAIGCAIAIVFANFGASYGMAKAGVGIMSSGVLRPDLLIRSTCSFWLFQSNYCKVGLT